MDQAPATMPGKVQAAALTNQGMGAGPDRGYGEKEKGIGNRIGSNQ